MFKKTIQLVASCLIIILMVACTKKKLGITDKKTVQVIGHRGAMGHALENTIESILKAIELKADMLEVDVHILKSGEIVVIHDKTTDRLSETKVKVSDLTLEEMKKITLQDGSTIPTLREVMDVMNHQIKLNVELKGSDTAIGTNEIIQEYIKNHGWAIDDFIISSFNYNELRIMRKVNSDIALAILPQKKAVEAIEIANEVSAEAINAHFKQITPETEKIIHDAGFKINVWTVNSSKDIQQMIDVGVDGIITNFPDRVNALK